jgi:hypothetical protein
VPYRYYGDAYDKVWPSTACFVTSNLFCCGKQESPLPQHCERQSPDVSQKNFQAAEQFGFIILGLAFLKKKKIKIVGHINLLFVWLQTYSQTSLSMFCFKSLHRKKEIQSKSCSRAPGYPWFQRISQRPSEQAKADWVAS